MTEKPAGKTLKVTTYSCFFARRILVNRAERVTGVLVNFAQFPTKQQRKRIHIYNNNVDLALKLFVPNQSRNNTPMMRTQGSWNNRELI